MKKDICKNTEIRIYPHLLKNLLLAFVCLAFAFVGLLMVKDVRTDWPTKIIGLFCCVLFMGGGGAAVLLYTLYSIVKRIPFLIIYEDRLCIYVQLKRTYQTVRFAEVDRFRMIHINSAKLITIDYKTQPLQRKLEETSGVKRRLMNLNLNVSGAVESFPCDSLTMKGNVICNLLNSRLKNFE